MICLEGETAIGFAVYFYNSIGAKPQNEWIIYRLTGQELIDFAQQ